MSENLENDATQNPETVSNSSQELTNNRMNEQENLQNKMSEEEVKDAVEQVAIESEVTNVDAVESTTEEPLVLEQVQTAQTIESPVLETVIPDLDKFEEHSDDVHVEEVTEAEVASLKKHSKKDLISLAIEASNNNDLGEAAQTFRKLRPVLDVLWNADYQAALSQFIENGGVKEEFEYKDETRDEYNAAYKVFANKREAHKLQLEKEKVKNLEIKRDILNKIKDIAEKEDSSNSLAEIKELQVQWKAIRAIPNENREELWNQYTYYLDKFYDNLGINNELKELDRRKNLEVKIDLCKKMDALLEEQSLRKAIVLQKKYWEDWKNTGPVPMEAKEVMWQRFKESADKIYTKITETYQSFEAERQQNLDAKIALCEQAEEIGRFESNLAKDWIAKIEDANKLFEAWKAIGPVSNKFNESIWDRFKTAINTFYENKNLFFKNIEKARAENLKVKTELCAKAEELQNSEDWGNATKKLLQFQEEWKKTGPVPEKHSEKIWLRFRTACDTFFERKKEFFASKVQDETKNLEAKNNIIAQLEELAKSETSDTLFDRVKTLQDEWGNYGFVPIKQKEDVQKRFKAVLDAIYQRIRKDFQANNISRHKNHYEVIARQNDGKNMLGNEEKRLSERIKLIKHDIETWQNNLGFFANSKNSEAFTKQIDDKIKDAQKKLASMVDQLKTLRDVKSGKSNAAPTTPVAEKETETPPTE